MTPQEPLYPARYQQLIEWLQPWLKKGFSSLTQVAGDASFRRYYRLAAKDNRENRDLIVMDAPPEKEASDRFLHLAQLWQQEGISVPRVIGSSLEEGFALLEDFGNKQLMQAVCSDKPEEADPLYRQALRQLAELQGLPNSKVQQLPHYDATLLQAELALFDQWLLDRLLQLNQSRPARWQDFQNQLVQLALAQPTGLVHRDYHSRNLMVTQGDQLGILDFQDAVIGPLTYDAVSLIRDCYLDWPEAWQQSWLEYFYQLTQPAASLEDYRLWFDWMGMQRHLKAAGIFVRLWLRDGKPSYLKDLPRTLQHLTKTLQHYPEWADISLWLSQEIQPRLENKLQLMKETTP